MPKSPRGKKGVDAMKGTPAKEEPKAAAAAPAKGKAAAAPRKASSAGGPRGARFDEHAVSQDLIWGMTKKRSAFLVKFNGNCWSKSPFSQTGFHNASESANTVGIAGKRELNDKKNVRRVFTLTLKHKRRNGIQKRKVGSQSKPSYSVHEVRREVNHTAKTIKALSWVDERERSALLRRLARSSRSIKSTQKGEKKTE
jgi:hypothetical protein